MGAHLVLQVLVRWTHLDDTSFRVLIRMAVTALDHEKDGKPPCLYFGGRELLARSLRRPFPEGDDEQAVKARKNIYGDVRKATKRLEKEGAIEVVDTGAAVRDDTRQTYRLTLLPALSGGVQDPPSGGVNSPPLGGVQNPHQGGVHNPSQGEERNHGRSYARRRWPR